MSRNPLESLVDALDVGAKVPPGVTLRYATVTSINPLRIQFDGESSPMPATPGTIASALPGDRMLVAHHGGTIATVLGRLGGPPGPPPPPEPLPEPVWASGANVNQMTGADSAWVTLSGGNVQIDLDLPAPAWVNVVGSGAFVINPGANLRMGVEVYGATSVAPNWPSWSTTAWAQLQSTATGQMVITLESSKTLRLNTGLNRIRLMAQRVGAANNSTINYPNLQVAPDRWAS